MQDLADAFKNRRWSRDSSEVHSKRTRAVSGHKVNSHWIWWKLFWQRERLGAGRDCPAVLWHPCPWKYSKRAWTTYRWTSSNFIAGLALSGVLDHMTSSGPSQPERSCDSRYVQHPPFPLRGVIERNGWDVLTWGTTPLALIHLKIFPSESQVRSAKSTLSWYQQINLASLQQFPVFYLFLLCNIDRI